MPKINIRSEILFVFFQLSLNWVCFSSGFANFNMNPQATLSQMRVQNLPQNKKFDLAKQAMNLITLTELSTCRCVNTLAPGKNKNMKTMW